ncbi:uncharacterized protein LOC100213719 [Hydra vulgaris]|uniref:uncharacterized protein LOC100213719 n=1 Tax=Hydra vulgaris TaxID=6087 RepID=UPI0002B4C8B7|nr:uncharacterized protein LOC100213719 [Hydra vulgaris]
MHIEYVFNMIVVATATQLTLQDKVTDMLEELADNIYRVGDANKMTIYGQKADKAISTAQKMYTKNEPFQEKHLSSKLFTSESTSDQLILRKLISLLETSASHDLKNNQQLKNIEKTETNKLGYFLKEFKEKFKNDMPPPPKSNGILLHRNNWEEEKEDDKKELNEISFLSGFPWRNVNNAKKETPKERDKEKPKWLPWYEKKELYSNMWSGISAAQDENEKDKKKISIIKRIVNDLNELFSLN